jgi:xanthine dehydrogenase accessory factor
MALAPLFRRVRVLVRGGGDLGSGVVYRLVQAGFPVLITERAQPLCVRRAVSFGIAALDGEVTVEGITARRVAAVEQAQAVIEAGEIPVLVDETDSAVQAFSPSVVVDARMLKRNSGTRPQDAPLIVALGPGYEAGVDCHVVIETNRGHALGRALWHGTSEPNTGTPGEVGGMTSQRVLYAPRDGFVLPARAIGDVIEVGETIATVGDVPVQASIRGVLRGLIHPEVPVTRGTKIGDLDPRARPEHCFMISEKSLAIGGGVLEAILHAEAIRRILCGP